MNTSERNPRNAGRKPKGRINSGLRLSPEVIAALDRNAAAHGRSRSDSAEALLAEVLKPVKD